MVQSGNGSRGMAGCSVLPAGTAGGPGRSATGPSGRSGLDSEGTLEISSGLSGFELAARQDGGRSGAGRGIPSPLSRGLPNPLGA